MKKSEFELFVIDKYLRASQKQNIYSYRQLENDPPDFLLKKGNQKIGCEITEFFNDYDEKGARSKRSESIYADIHEKIRQKLLVEIPNGYSFRINYKPNILGHVNKEKETTEVINLLKNNLDKKYIKVTSCSIKDINVRKMPNSNTRIILSTIQDFIKPSDDMVNRIICSKNFDLTKWKTDTTEKWLLIHFGRYAPNSYSIKDFKRLKKIEYYDFDKIVLFDGTYKEYLDFDKKKNTLAFLKRLYRTIIEH